LNAPVSAGDLAPHTPPRPGPAPTSRPSPRFEALYRDNYAFVWRCARRMCVDDSDLEDVIQDVFVIAYRRLGSLAPGVAPSTWLFGIMRNVVRNRARGRGRQQRRLGAIARDVEARERHRQRIETELGERVLAGEMLLGFLRELDESQRAVFVLAELEGHSAKQIAGALEINANTASSRLRLARRAFCMHFGVEPSGRGVHELTRALREQPEQPEASVQNRSWGLLLVAVAEPGGLATGGMLTLVSGKLAALIAGVTMVATLTVVAVQTKPDATIPAASRSSTSQVPSASRSGTTRLGDELSVAVAQMPELEPAPIQEPVIVQAKPARLRTQLPSPAEQLRRARAALIAGDAARTLELLETIDDADTRLLGQRIATEVAALCRLGEVERARLVVEQLRVSDPNAPVLAQIDDACW
jgi:RNA polymerase sigma factor (sigma-70 family)